MGTTIVLPVFRLIILSSLICLPIISSPPQYALCFEAILKILFFDQSLPAAGRSKSGNKKLPFRAIRKSRPSSDLIGQKITSPKAQVSRSAKKREKHHPREMVVEEVGQFLLIEIFNNNQMHDQYYLFDIQPKIINYSASFIRRFTLISQKGAL